jgi:hypothetical protein
MNVNGTNQPLFGFLLLFMRQYPWFDLKKDKDNSLLDMRLIIYLKQ